MITVVDNIDVAFRIGRDTLRVVELRGSRRPAVSTKTARAVTRNSLDDAIPGDSANAVAAVSNVNVAGGIQERRFGDNGADADSAAITVVRH